jgi:hypothetical protein
MRACAYELTKSFSLLFSSGIILDTIGLSSFNVRAFFIPLLCDMLKKRDMIHNSEFSKLTHASID